MASRGADDAMQVGGRQDDRDKQQQWAEGKTRQECSTL
jgi:hypothetical protein